jgi:hypothetical protein
MKTGPGSLHSRVNYGKRTSRPTMILFPTLQLLIQAWYINTSAAQGESLTGRFRPPPS